MGFIKKIWKDRISEFPTRRSLTKTDGTSELVTVARSEGMISEEGDAFSAENMNDFENRVESGFNELTENLSKNTFGDQVTLVNNQSYTCPTDGYFRIVCGYQATSRVVGIINDITLASLSSTNSSSVVINNSLASVIFVRAGTTIKYTGTNAHGYYIPLI